MEQKQLLHLGDVFQLPDFVPAPVEQSSRNATVLCELKRFVNALEAEDAQLAQKIDTARQLMNRVCEETAT